MPFALAISSVLPVPLCLLVFFIPLLCSLFLSFFMQINQSLHRPLASCSLRFFARSLRAGVVGDTGPVVSASSIALLSASCCLVGSPSLCQGYALLYLLCSLFRRPWRRTFLCLLFRMCVR